jgi:predicted nucleic acid-binding Zn ribbon protein
VRAELSRFGPQAGLGDLLERWPEAVGEAIARNAWPARIARDGTLHVSTADSVWAFELAHRAPEIAERLGVPKVRFTPGPLPSRAEGPPAPDPIRPTPEHVRAAAEIAAGIMDENLRESVQKAVSFGLARPPSDRPF